MIRKLIFRARVMLVCALLMLPVLIVISHLTTTTGVWMMVAIIFWAMFVGMSVGHLGNLKRLQRLIEAIRDRGLSQAEVEAIMKKRSRFLSGEL